MLGSYLSNNQVNSVTVVVYGVLGFLLCILNGDTLMVKINKLLLTGLQESGLQLAEGMEIMRGSAL